MYYTLEQALSMAHGTVHAAPQGNYTVADAHRVMRLHVECRSWLCPAKGTALDVLVLAGRITPDPARWDGRIGGTNMATRGGAVTVASRLGHTQRAVLCHMGGGALHSTAEIAVATGLRLSQVRNGMTRLFDHGHVEPVPPAKWVAPEMGCKPSMSCAHRKRLTQNRRSKPMTISNNADPRIGGHFGASNSCVPQNGCSPDPCHARYSERGQSCGGQPPGCRDVGHVDTGDDIVGIEPHERSDTYPVRGRQKGRSGERSDDAAEGTTWFCVRVKRSGDEQHLYCCPDDCGAVDGQVNFSAGPGGAQQTADGISVQPWRSDVGCHHRRDEKCHRNILPSLGFETVYAG